MWSAVLPVKRLGEAKTRLRGAVPGVAHHTLVLAIALDTLGAVLACPAVGTVLVVTDDAALATAARRLGARVSTDPPGRGLNPALTHGARLLSGPVVALTGDLPALRPDELSAALAEAAPAPRAYLADAERTGTTLLTAAGADLDPRFGPGSAAAHALSGAVPLAGTYPSVRRDVDTPANLAEATTLGLGPRTALLQTARTA